MARPATLRRLVLLARPEWRLLGAGLFFLALGSAMGLLYPQGIRVIVDGVLGSHQAELVDRAALFMPASRPGRGMATSARAIFTTGPARRALAPSATTLFSPS